MFEYYSEKKIVRYVRPHASLLINHAELMRLVFEGVDVDLNICEECVALSEDHKTVRVGHFVCNGLQCCENDISCFTEMASLGV
jgi:hypothetical protein